MDWERTEEEKSISLISQKLSEAESLKENGGHLWAKGHRPFHHRGVKRIAVLEKRSERGLGAKTRVKEQRYT